MLHFLNSRHCPNMLDGTGCGGCSEIGLLSGTQIRVRHGYIAVENLTTEHEVAVFPQGFQRPAQVSRRAAFGHPRACPAHVRPVLFPRGAIGIHGEVIVQHEARLLLGDPDFRKAFGTPYVTVAVADLVGFRGIEVVEPVPRDLITFRFQSDEVVAVDDSFRLVLPGLDPQSDMPGQRGFGRLLLHGIEVREMNAHQTEDYLAALDGLLGPGASWGKTAV